MEREPLSAVDAAWLGMGSDENPMVITAVLVFARPVARELVLETMTRVSAEGRFRARVRRSISGASWEKDPTFEVASHVARVACPAPGDRAALEGVVSDLRGQPLDPDRPLWHVTVVDGVGGGSAVVARVHHALGDGMALVSMLLGLGGASGGVDLADVGVAPPAPTGAVDLAKTAADHVATLGRLVIMPSDPKTPLKGALGTRKLVAWTERLPLDRVKAVARALGAKVNDVMTALVSAAVADELARAGALEDGLEVHALVPVFFRGSAGMGNHFGLVFLALPLGTRDPRDRVRAVARRMALRKEGADAAVSWEVLAAMGVASAELERVGIEIFSRKATMLVTNVPGPPVPLPLFGQEIADLVVCAPNAGHIGLGFSILSYAGAVRACVGVDARLVDDARRLTDSMERHWATLEAATLGG